ncbi:hypothetical protein TNCV_4432521 [Trichonephila clavipes]|nr:hypothetical protein TNCV_4432521 [Trichonephila clavipes]
MQIKYVEFQSTRWLAMVVWRAGCQLGCRRRHLTDVLRCELPVVKVSDHDIHVMSSNPVPIKARRVGKDLIDELKIFGMSSQHHIDDFMRGRIIGKIEEGRKITDVAREFDIAHSVVSRLWKSFKTTGMCSRRHGGGC